MRPVQLDKENSVIPSTPAQQLKASTLESFNGTRNNKNPSISPSKRLPFASKDNNASVSKNLFSSIVKQPLEPPQEQVHSNNIQNDQHHYLNNKKRLKKYGSILGQAQPLSLRNVPSVHLPCTKSVILKDLGDDKGNDSESGSESDEEWNSNNPFQLKLQNALNKAQEQPYPTNQIIVENEIEYKSEPIEEIPYIPDGYTPFTQEDLHKLSEYNPHDVLLDGTVVKDTSDCNIANLNSPTLLPLELDLDTEDQETSKSDDLIKTQTHTSANHPMTMTHNNVELVSLDLEYNGQGLTNSDIMDLIDSI